MVGDTIGLLVAFGAWLCAWKWKKSTDQRLDEWEKRAEQRSDEREKRIVNAFEEVRDAVAEGIPRNVPAAQDEPVEVRVRREIVRRLEKGLEAVKVRIPPSGVREAHAHWDRKLTNKIQEKLQGPF